MPQALHSIYRSVPYTKDEIFRAFYQTFMQSDAGRIVYEVLLHDLVLFPVLQVDKAGEQALGYINLQLRGYDAIERKTDG